MENGKEPGNYYVGFRVSGLHKVFLQELTRWFWDLRARERL